MVSQAWKIITFDQKAGDFATFQSTNGPKITEVKNPPAGTNQIQT